MDEEVKGTARSADASASARRRPRRECRRRAAPRPARSSVPSAARSTPAPSRAHPRFIVTFRQWIHDYFLGDDPGFGLALVPFCFLSMLLFTRHPEHELHLRRAGGAAREPVRAEHRRPAAQVPLARRVPPGLLGPRPRAQHRLLPAHPRPRVARALGPRRARADAVPPPLGERAPPRRERRARLRHRLPAHEEARHARGSPARAFTGERRPHRGGERRRRHRRRARRDRRAARAPGALAPPAVDGASASSSRRSSASTRRRARSAACRSCPLARAALRADLPSRRSRAAGRAPSSRSSPSAAAFVFYVEARRRMFPAPLPPELSDRGQRGQALGAARLRGDPPLVRAAEPAEGSAQQSARERRRPATASPARCASTSAGSCRSSSRYPLSGDYSAPQEPIPDGRVSPESILGGARSWSLPFPLAAWLGVRSYRRLEARASATEARLLGDVPYRGAAHAMPVRARRHLARRRRGLPVDRASRTSRSRTSRCCSPTVRAERFWYFPAIGSSLLLALRVRAVARAAQAAERWRARRVVGVILVFFGIQAVCARRHANDYTDDLTFWDATRKAVPRSAKAHLNYSVMKGARGDLEGAPRGEQGRARARAAVADGEHLPRRHAVPPASRAGGVAALRARLRARAERREPRRARAAVPVGREDARAEARHPEGSSTTSRATIRARGSSISAATSSSTARSTTASTRSTARAGTTKARRTRACP